MRHRGARRHEQVRVVRHDAVLLVQVEREVEATAQLGEVLERAAQEGDVAADGAAAGEAGDGLRHHGLEDRGGHVLRTRALVEQRLHVRLGEHAAAARDRVDRGRTRGELVEPARIGVEQRRHLIDERTGAARARAVHALLDTRIEIDDLGVLAAELDRDVRLRDQGLDRALGGDDLLDELEAEPLRKQKAARTGDGARHLRLGHELRGAFEQIARACAHVGVMPLVLGVHNIVRIVEHGELDGGRPHVDAEVERTACALGIPDGAVGQDAVLVFCHG